MDPSEDKKDTPVPKKTKSYLIPACIGLLILAAVAGASVYFLNKESVEPVVATTESVPAESPAAPVSQHQTPPPVTKNLQQSDTPKSSSVPLVVEQVVPQKSSDTVAFATNADEAKPHSGKEKKPVDICTLTTKDISRFYTTLDGRNYIKAYGIAPSSRVHFTALIEKLLANPPKVTGETDDLYTILRNTAHFFRVSGKDNILMMKGVLNREQQSLEKLLADYYFLLSSPECDTNEYIKDLNKDGLYEYACFFLNTMGGRLYLFRRDSLSRMVVTYYAILLVDQANIQNRNSHGISLKPAVNMLISEMEANGSALQHSDEYLDMLYDLKEKYQ